MNSDEEESSEEKNSNNKEESSNNEKESSDKESNDDEGNSDNEEEDEKIRDSIVAGMWEIYEKQSGRKTNKKAEEVQNSLFSMGQDRSVITEEVFFVTEHVWGLENDQSSLEVDGERIEDTKDLEDDKNGGGQIEDI